MKDWISPIDPKIHFIWIGTNPYPDYFVHFLRGFQKMCPEFTIKVWTNKDLNKSNFPITYPYIQKIKKLHGNPIKEYTNARTMYKSNLEPISRFLIFLAKVEPENICDALCLILLSNISSSTILSC